MKLSAKWKNKARSVLPWKTYWFLKRLREEWRAVFSRNDLPTLAGIYQTDKGSHHEYMNIYHQWIGHLRYSPIKLLEIGVGGYDKLLMGGDSLRMWKRFFPKATIIGIDFHDKTGLQEDRIRIYTGDQSDISFLNNVIHDEGPFDIIIDDGSHVQSDIITSFETLFPSLRPGGIYVIEDTQTSYWPKYGGSTAEMKVVHSAMNYFIQHVHDVNIQEWKQEDLHEPVKDIGIASIAFYHNLIFIVKK